MFVSPGSRGGRGAAINTLYLPAAPVIVPYAATLTLDFADGRQFNFQVASLTGNITSLANPLNAKIGQSGIIRLVQDGTGSRLLSAKGSMWLFAGGIPTLSTAAAAIDDISYFVWDATTIHATIGKAFA